MSPPEKPPSSYLARNRVSQRGPDCGYRLVRHHTGIERIEVLLQPLSRLRPEYRWRSEPICRSGLQGDGPFDGLSRRPKTSVRSNGCR